MLCGKLLQSCLTMTLWIAAGQAPLSMGFSRQEYWSGFTCPPPGDLPDPRMHLLSLLHCQMGSLPLVPPWKALSLSLSLSVCVCVCVWMCQFSSVQSLVVSDSLRTHELQHTRPPCPSPTPRVHSNSRPSSRWCHPAILSSVVPFFSCPQSLPASESFPMSQLFAWGGQSATVSALVSFLPKNTQDGSPLE